MKSLAENQLKVQVARWRKKPGRVLKIYIQRYGQGFVKPAAGEENRNTENEDDVDNKANLL